MNNRLSWTSAYPSTALFILAAITLVMYISTGFIVPGLVMWSTVTAAFFVLAVFRNIQVIRSRKTR